MKNKGLVTWVYRDTCNLNIGNLDEVSKHTQMY